MVRKLQSQFVQTAVLRIQLSTKKDVKLALHAVLVHVDKIKRKQNAKQNIVRVRVA